jgi:hypothetical protein
VLLNLSAFVMVEESHEVSANSVMGVANGVKRHCSNFSTGWKSN